MIQTTKIGRTEPIANTDLERKDVIAELTDSVIRTLSADGLRTVVRAASIPFVQEERLPLQDRDTLERLAFLARNCCRNAVV